MTKKQGAKTPVEQPVKPAVKKKARKAVKVKAPEFTQATFEAWFFALDSKVFVKLQRDWNEKNLKIDLTPQKDYDSWFNYFKTLPPNTTRALATTGLESLSTEAYAALIRWHDIIKNPHRIDKIHQSGLTAQPKEKGKGMVELAMANDRLGVLMAIRDQLTEKLAKGTGARDTAALARELTDVMSQIAAYEKKMAPSKATVLGKLTGDMPSLNKRSRKAGVRRGSYSAKPVRVTIADVEGDHD